jgi:WD40 repeat protein
MICTGSKDKSVAVSSLGSLQAAGSTGEPLWRSQFHTAKVGAVKLKGRGSTILASASDDGLVALHDFRANGCGRTSESYSSSLVAKLEDAHDRPHSVLWDRSNEFVFVTAGLDPIVKVWDQRNLSKPVACLQGHVPTSTSRCKRIHRPVFFDPSFLTPTYPKQFTGPRVCPFLLTGGQGSASVSVYKLGMRRNEESLFSRGKLPVDCGDSGCIAVNGKQVAVAVDQGEIMILEPSSAQ